MDLFMLLFLSCTSIIIGVILTLVLQYYVLLHYFDKTPTKDPPKKIQGESYSLPEELKKKLEMGVNDNDDCSLAVSLMFQFLFHELRHTESIKRWLYKKLSLEFEELISKTTTGKFFDAVTIRDMDLGSQFPNIKNIGVENVKLDNTEGHIDTLNLCVKLDYSGNFLLSVDAKMKFGKTAYLSIKVKHVSGLARLQFTRLPYTHWSFSFYGEPELELAVESHFQGRQLQSNVTNLIVNQIKKAIKRKHTLPNYKIRYKPFFVKSDPGQLDLDDSEIVPQGQLEMMCIEISRLATTADILYVFCTFAIDSIPWICIYQRESNMYVVLELTISKLHQQPLGVAFKMEQNCVVVDNVTPQMAADHALLKSGDIVLAVDGKLINNITQLNKFIKMQPVGNFSIRVERIANNYIMKSKYFDKTEMKTPTLNTNSIIEDEGGQTEESSFVIVENIKPKINEAGDSSKKLKSSSSLEKSKSGDKMPLPKLISSSNENVSKFAQTIGNFSLRKRKTSIERTSTDSSNKSTPNPSTPSTPQHTNFKPHIIQVPSVALVSAKRQCIMEVTESEKTENTDPFVSTIPNTENVDIYKGHTKDSVCVISFKDEFLFNLRESDKYLNINVWGMTTSGKDSLLGFMNIPITEVLNECNNSILGHYMRTFSFLPPTNASPTNQYHPLMAHSGFEHVFCYGDALLQFMWTHDEITEIKRKPAPSSTDFSTQNETAVLTKHDFVRTQFHRTTHCDFCSKKIWLKDAVQCKKCGLCCHKKCLSKCQVNMPCIPMDLEHKSDNSDSLQPEIVMTEVIDDDLDCELKQYQGDTQQNFSGIKRVNSANNLSIPGSYFSQNHSRSLPPSPQHTPRKLSLVASNPFSICPIILDEIQEPIDSNEIITRAVEQVLQYPMDEALMDVAKETGTQLYSNMAQSLKFDKINHMVTELKKALDDATVDHMNLSKQINNVESEVEKAKLAFQIGQADAKIQALSVLMLHYCSGLQHSQEKIV